MSTKRLYETIIEYLLEQIKLGKFSYEKPLCTEKQLEERFQVSNITAKRAITELEHKGILYRKRGVGSFVTRQSQAPVCASQNGVRIYAAVYPFNISPGSAAMAMIQTFNTRLNPRGGYVPLYTTDRDKRQERNVLQQLLPQGLSGLIYYPNTNDVNLDLLQQFVVRNTSVVVVDKTVPAPFVHNVTCDNFDGARQITDYLIAQGHSRIAYISSSTVSKLSSVCERVGGYLYAMRKASLPVNKDWIVTKLKDSIEEYRPVPSEEQRERIRKLLLHFRENGVTAIECENDGMAETVLRCCRELSLRVPEDLSVCGFDGRPPELGELPFFTSAYQDLNAIAERVAEVLLRTMDSALPLGEKIRIPVELQIGRSTAPCRK